MAGNTVKEMTTNFGKLDKFEGHDFRRWQKKMHFLLTTLKVVYVLTTPMPELLEDATVEAIRIRAKWENDDYICRGHILNGMYDSLSLMYIRMLNRLRSYGIHLNPSTWHRILLDFKHTLKHGKDDLSLVQLGSHLRIEESLRAQDSDKGKGKEVVGPSVNMTEEVGEPVGSCAKTGHFKRDCRSGNKKNANAGGSGKGLMQLRGGLILVLQLMFVKIVAGLRHMNRWKDGICTFSGDIISLLFMEKEVAVVRLPDPKRKTLGEKVEGSRDQVGSQYSYCYSIEEDPRTYNEAMQSRDFAFWKEAIDDEIGSIMENNTWVLSDLTPGCKPLGCKWIFKRKMKVDGTIDKFKARLVIQGFRQKERIDYFDTYAPVARITTIILLLALAAIHNLVIHQMDVKTAFLNGDLDEEVYMKQPEGFVMPGNEHKVCKLVKSLYGLKQAPKQWHKKFDEVVLSSGFLLNQSDKCVYSKFSSSCEGVIICLYVDDMLIFGTDRNQVDKPVDRLEYSRAIVCLMYAMTSTRPDIAYAVGRLSRFTSNPSRQHWQAITRVFKYLKGTMNYGLSYMGYPSVLEGYSDASWINHVEDSSSTSGWVFLLGGGAISWASKKQTCITGSTMESEFVALAAAGKEAEWLRNLIHEIPIWPKPIAPISIRCDSAPTMAKAYSQIYNGKSRHLGVRHSMIRELIMNGVISIEFVRSQKNLADHLTKGLARDLVNKLETPVYLSSRGARTKRTTYVNMKFCRFKKLGLGFLYVH
ncbi:zinc finger, CCHC-type containing protein [Tanacetum coccineum]|uniref:Zinc finger, CCHC-type containing protein n=1 Tax=Tanacetum coccineum TaxID=301880 RepID=A0ABQ5G288_9ASTR